MTFRDPEPTNVLGVFAASCPEHGWAISGSLGAVRRGIDAHATALHATRPFEPFVCASCLTVVASTECEGCPHGDLCCECHEADRRADALESDEANRACDIARGA